MTRTPATKKALRHLLARVPDGPGADRLVAYLRDPPPPSRSARWSAVQALMGERPDLVRVAANRLLEDPVHRPEAAVALARLHNRQQAWVALRALILTHAEAPPTDARDWLSGLLRISLVAPGVVSPAEWERALALQPPAAQSALALQHAVAHGAKPDVGGYLARLDRLLARATAQGLPEALTRLWQARDVAVVGNGSGLTGARAAAAIEAHDIVIRMNYPVLSGHEEDTGRRTDLMLFAEPKRQGLPGLIAREPAYAGLPAFGVRGFVSNRPTREGPPSIPGDLARTVGMLSYTQPTTGFFAILLAGVLFRRPITLFGFDFFAEGRPGHYFGPTHAAPQHELAYERWYTEAIVPLLCPQLRVGT